MWTVKFWKDAIERAIKTAAQGSLGSIAGWNIATGGTDWQGVLVTTGVAVGISFLTSLLSSLAGNSDSASMAKDVG